MTAARADRRGVPAARREFNAEFARGIRAGRERLAQHLGHEVTQREMAERLSRLAGYTVSADSYRKYENSKKPVALPMDLLFHFAEFTYTTPDALTAPVDPSGACWRNP